MRTIAIALAVAVLVVAAAPAFASDESLDLEVKVIDVVRQHDQFADRLTFTVNVTNTGTTRHTIDNINIHGIWDREHLEFVSDTCVGSFSVRAGQTTELQLCFLVHPTHMPRALSFTELHVKHTRAVAKHQHILPFADDVCGVKLGITTCQKMQRIHDLIENVASEPEMCVPARSPMPNLGNTAYHRYLHDILLTFDIPVTLADGWHENIRIYAETRTDSIELDGLDMGALNLMPDDSTLVWLSLDYEDARQLNDVTNMTLRISPGTVTYGDGGVLRTVLLPPVKVVP